MQDDSYDDEDQISGDAPDKEMALGAGSIGMQGDRQSETPRNKKLISELMASAESG